MKTIIAGSRSVLSYAIVRRVMDAYVAQNGPVTQVVSGCAPGVDQLGIRWALENGIPVLRMPADWKNINHPQAVIQKHPNGRPYNANAGLCRNLDMAEVADRAVLFWDMTSTGTKHMRDSMLALGKPVFIHDVYFRVSQ